MKELNAIYNEDCLIGMKDIEDGSIDAIICDLPYGVLNKTNPKAKWDCPIPFDELWKQYERIIKDNGVIILFGSGMFTADLMQSNRKLWKYNLIWKKGNRPSGFLNAKKMPLRCHEDICVFYKNPPTYNPQMVIGKPNHSRGKNVKVNSRCYGNYDGEIEYKDTNEKYPISIIDIDKEHTANGRIHPTQKPVELIRWLVRTYTNQGDTVLDNCVGSGTTAIACIKERRNFIGFETDTYFYKKAIERINNEIN